MATIINTNKFPVPLGEGVDAICIPAFGRRNVPDSVVPKKLPAGVKQLKAARTAIKPKGDN